MINNKSALIWVANGLFLLSLLYKIATIDSDKSILGFIFYYFILVTLNSILGFIFSNNKLPFYKITIVLLSLFLPLLFLLTIL